MMKQRHPRSEIGLAEVLEICRTLGVREGTYAQWLAESLGLTWKESGVNTQPAQPAPVASLPTPTEGVDDPSQKREPKTLKLLAPLSQEPMAFEQVFAGQTEEIRNAKEITPASPEASSVRPEFVPLLLDRWFQGIFTAVLGVRVPSPEIDFRKLERYVNQGEFFTNLPFKTRTKLVKGVHVLLDRSESMQPFWRDQTELLSRLRRMLGAALVEPTWFEYDGHSSRIVWPASMPRQFRMETPVLVVTDFGSGLDMFAAQTMNWEPWLPLLEQARSSRSRIFALIPSAQNYWPATLRRFVDCSLLWDRETSPQVAAKLCRK